MPKLSLQNDLFEVLEMFPKITLNEDNKKKSLIGEVDVFDALCNYIDSYEVKVLIPVNYPYDFPTLLETSKKFEHCPDRHVSDDGSCCVCSLQEADIKKQTGITIKSFFLKYVLPYLANQIYYDTEEEWANGDFQHGFDGIFQFYSEVLRTNDIEKVLSLLILFNSEKLNRNDKCFCGESKKLKHCHLKEYKKITNLSKQRMSCDILVIKKMLSDRINH